MPTAIVRYMTGQGFVIAADGRSRNERLEVIADNLQKIFPVPERPLVAAVYGNAGIGNEGDAEPILVDVASELRRSMEALMGRNMGDLVEYAEKLSRPIYRMLFRVKNDGLLHEYPGQSEENEPGSTIAHIFLFGYFNGIPSEVDIRFFHRDQRLSKPSCQSRRISRSNPEIWGSRAVAQRLFMSDDPRFTQYRTDKVRVTQAEQLTVTDAVELARNYISACNSDLGRETDPDLCPGIGGHVHIASIREQGFQWIEPPQQP